jgi:4-amino-4-deoxy-L-arabinose transferase-like glycosyltransferase
VNRPTPAIVTQAGARRFPRPVLLLLCCAYVLCGFVGRDAWKSADMAALGYMVELARGSAQWLSPTLMGLPADNPAVLPYWLGAWMLQISPDSLNGADWVVRIPFMLLLALAMMATWYGTYYLARSPQAQPVAFAFGGEANPADYARVMADGGLLALMACLGLAHLSHETTPALAQLGFCGLFFFGVSALPYRRVQALVAVFIGLVGMALSGAPTLATLLGLGSACIHALDPAPEVSENTAPAPQPHMDSAALLIATLLAATLAWTLDLWRWKIELPHAQAADWNGYLQLLVWFTWPAGPMAVWTLWRWRHQLFRLHTSRHIALPTWFVTVCVCATLTTGSSDRTLLLALPALAALAAFALPTLKRQVAALIDWFTLLFFSGCGITIWVVWVAMQTGFPAQPAANVARLAPGFESSFSALGLGVALVATWAWGWLVQWRVGRHRAAIWKSLVLPSAGAALCWLLLMTLWMPLLNYAQSYTSFVQRTLDAMDETGCVETLGLSEGQIAAFQYYGKLQLRSMQLGTPVCNWLLAEPRPDSNAPEVINRTQWNLQADLRHPVDANESVLLFKRIRSQ